MGNTSGNTRADKLIYLDNNATTFMTTEVKQAMLDWCNKGNPSSGHIAARESKCMMNDFREYIGKLCSFTVPNHTSESTTLATNGPVRDGNDGSMYHVIFTSGASEANCTVFHSVITAYASARGSPHVIMSAIEHKSLIDMAKSYESRNIITVSFIGPEISGHILVDAVADAIQPNTCLICIMHANNETGAINDIRAIGALAHSNNIPFHCDTAQTFGKAPIRPLEDHVDSFCISFHKLHGPPGVGALVIKRDLVAGYNLQPYIYGTQNSGMRGGTENLPGIGAAYIATRYTMIDRPQKNVRMQELKKFIMNSIAKYFPTRQYAAYMNDTRSVSPNVEIVFLSDGPVVAPGRRSNVVAYLPNTILLSVVKRSGAPICNSQIRADLESRGVIISIGSACNTASPKASHVLYAMGSDELVRKGALRITLGDLTTQHEATQFINIFVEIIRMHISE